MQEARDHLRFMSERNLENENVFLSKTICVLMVMALTKQMKDLKQ